MSLIELLVALAISALLFGLAVWPLKRSASVSKANPEAVAAVLAAELRSARLRAMYNQTAVAVVIPSRNGTVGHAQSLYVLEGHLPATGVRTPPLDATPEPPPKMSRVVNFADEYPGVFIYAGGWNVDPSLLTDPTLTPAIGDGMGASLENWTKPTSKDYQIVFDGDGGVISNDLPHFDGAFHLLVASNLNYATGTAPPGTGSMATAPGYFNLTGAYKPITISVSLQGGVTTTREVLAQTGVTDCGPGNPSVPSASPPVQTVVINTAPKVADFKVLPPSNPDFSDSFDATVRPDGFLTLVIRIVDAQDDQVSCQWDSLPAAAPGTFTIPPGKQTIEFDEVQGCWVASAVWQPPPNAKEGDQFSLMATVVDAQGAQTVLNGTAAIQVKTKIAGHYFFSDGGFICSLTGDGSSIRRLARGADPVVSPDGSMVAFVQGTDIAVMQSDGSQAKVITSESGLGSPTWSPDGLYLAMDHVVAGGSEVKFLRLFDQKISTVKLPGAHPRWSSQGSLVYQQTESASGLTKLTTAAVIPSDLFLATPVPPTPTTIALPAPYDTVSATDATWSSDGAYLTFQSGTDICSVDAAATTVVKRYTPPAGKTAQRNWLLPTTTSTQMVFIESNGTTGDLRLCNLDLAGSGPASFGAGSGLLRSGNLTGSCSWAP